MYCLWKHHHHHHEQNEDHNSDGNIKESGLTTKVYPLQIEADNGDVMNGKILSKFNSCCCETKFNQPGCYCIVFHKKDKEQQTTTKSEHRQDLWKFHLCQDHCLHYDNLLYACTDLNAEGACLLHSNRCQFVNASPEQRQTLGICEPGCLDCSALRTGCYV